MTVLMRGLALLEAHKERFLFGKKKPTPEKSLPQQCNGFEENPTLKKKTVWRVIIFTPLEDKRIGWKQLLQVKYTTPPFNPSRSESLTFRPFVRETCKKLSLYLARLVDFFCGYWMAKRTESDWLWWLLHLLNEMEIVVLKMIPVFIHS